MHDVLCIGEALVDFLPEEPGQKVRDVERWRRCTGGSPANVAVGVARLGARSAMLGVIGEDEFGIYLRQSLSSEGVDVSHLRQTGEGKTGLVFISLTASGERSFSFFRTRAAESLLDQRDVDHAFARGARALHCGTNSLLYPEARAAVLQLVDAAFAAGQLVSSDPNLRLHLWKEPSELREWLGLLMPRCALMKLADDEIEFVTGTKEIPEALTRLRERGVLLPVVTAGPRGAHLLWKGELRSVPAPQVTAVDTTGAGDGFTAALLFGLTRLFSSRAELERADGATLESLARFACEVGSRVVTKLGAVSALPRRAEVEALLPPALRGR